MRKREVSPRELTEHYLDRIAGLDHEVGAYLTVVPELARAQAAAAETALRDDTCSSPLLGVPVPVKDLTAVEGVRCTFGSLAYAEHVASWDDHVVTRLREAGTIMLGKTNTPEFALPCYTENRLAPPTRNPWDPTRSPGGSSGGSAAAVAAGLAPIAHGTDAGGSIRIPASACGLVGIKPSRGRVSNGPSADVAGLSVHGPLARTVADAAALLDVMSGPAPGDSRTALALPAGETFLEHARREPGSLRVAAMLQPMVPGVAPHPDCTDGYRRTALLLDALGHRVTELDAPSDPLLVEAFSDVLAVLSALPSVPDESVLMPFTRSLRAGAASVPGARFAQAVSLFHEAGQRLADTLFAEYDVILSPTLGQLPGLIGALRDDGDPTAEFAAMAAFMPYTPLANITGLPSVNVPLHWNSEGLPVGSMLTARHGAEPLLISLAAQLEAAQPWSGRRPALW